MNRREFLRRTLSVGAGATAIAALPTRASAVGTPAGFASLSAAKNWNDPSAWGSGKVPGANDVAMVTGPVVLDQSASVAGVEIMEGGELYFDPASTVTLESTGNIVVHGLFSLRPSSSVVHTVRFVGVNEAAFVGGGMEVLDSDVGLWVVHMGILDAVGTPKVAWNRTGNDPTWLSSDQLIVAPTAPGDYDGFQSFTKGSAVPKARGEYPAEVLNLTRNVVIEGTPGGRAHVLFLHAMRAQTVQYVEIRHMGPRQPGDRDPTEGVTGRYPLHFHHGGDAVRGSLIEGVAVHQSGNRAFVPHGSHGITLRNCVAYDIMDTAYWWDLPGGGDNDSHDVLFDSCVAAWVKSDPPYRGFNLSGFLLGHGNGNTCINSVSVGIQGNQGASGFFWPPMGGGAISLWTFQNNVSHNNKVNGMAVWQNQTLGHLVDSTLVYQVGGAAIRQGAYHNHYHYQNITAIDCQHVIDLHAHGLHEPMLFTNVIGIDIREEHVLGSAHVQPGDGALFIGGLLTSIKIDNNPSGDDGGNPGIYDFVDTGIEPSGVNIESVVPGTLVRIQNGSNAWQVDSGGNVASIAPFSDGGTPAPPPATTTTTVQSTTTTAPPTTSTTSPSATTTTTAGSGGSGGNRQRRRRRGSPGPLSASSTNGSGDTTSVGGDFVAFSGGAAPAAAPSIGIGSSQAARAQASTTPPVLGLSGSARATLPASSGPIAKQLVSRAVPVSLNVPAALGPVQPSPAEPSVLGQLATPAGLAMTAAAAAAVALYRRRIAATQIPDSLQAYRATSVGEGVKPVDGDPWT